MTDGQHIPSTEELALAYMARERRVKRRTAFLIIVPAILGLALIALAYAKQMTLIEKRERSIADLSKTVDRLQNDNAALRATIQECDTKFQGQTRLLSELQRNAVARRTPDLATLRAVDLAVRESPGVQQSIAKTVRESSERRVSRIYLQIADEGQRDPARSVQDYLLSQGYNAPGIEKVGLKAPTDVTQVRYFVPADKNAAVRVVELLQSKYSIRAKSSNTRIRNPVPGQLEIWFTPDALKNLSVH
jgi:hypothetical protein